MKPEIEELNVDKLWKLYEIALSDLKWAMDTKDFSFVSAWVLNEEKTSGCLLGAVLLKRFDFVEYKGFHDFMDEQRCDFIHNKLYTLGFCLYFGIVGDAYSKFYQQDPIKDYEFFEFSGAEKSNGYLYLEKAKDLLAYLKEEDI